MARNFGIIPQPLRIEQAARISTAYLPDGRLWHANDRLPRSVAFPLIGAIGLLTWAFVIGVGVLAFGAGRFLTAIVAALP